MFCHRHINSPQVLAVAEEAGRDGLPRRARDPELLGYARHFVLQDHMFEPTTSWSLPGPPRPRLRLVGEVRARRRPDELRQRDPGAGLAARRAAEHDRREPDYAWTDLTYLLHSDHVSVALLRLQGHAARLRGRRDVLQAVKQNAKTPGIWNPLPWFDTVKQDGQRENVAPFEDFLDAARRGDAASGLVAHAGARR